MANVERLVEALLRRYDPAIDLSASSEVRRVVVQPLVEEFGDDPLDADLETFLLDRVRNEHADLAPTSGDAFHQLLINPSRTLLEPFRREIERVLRNQSTRSATLTPEDADALAANFFAPPRQGGQRAAGTVRVYFGSPTQAVIDRPLVTFNSDDGLVFHPISRKVYSPELMATQKEGSLYYVDVNVVADEDGDEYNIPAESIVSATGLHTSVSVVNKADFHGGDAAETTSELMTRVEASLAERSLNTSRGINAALLSRFPNAIRALEIIKHGDVEMTRDVLTGSAGHVIQHTGLGVPVDNLFVANTDDVLGAQDPSVGDEIVIFFAHGLYDTADFNQAADRFETFKITGVTTSVPFGGGTVSVYELDGTPTQVDPDGDAFEPDINGASPVVYWIRSVAAITVTDIPGGIVQRDGAIVVKDGEVHLGGHVDVMLRPRVVESSSISVNGAVDESSIEEGEDLTRVVQAGVVSSAGSDFVTTKVRPGDSLHIESGDFIGIYQVLSVNSLTELLVDGDFTVAFAAVRFRIVRDVDLALYEPKQVKVPFNTNLGDDLSTVAGSTIFHTVVDLKALGAVIGDTLRVLGGVSKGDYTIESFSGGLGTAPVMTVVAPATEAALKYTLFSPKGAGVGLPMVRVSRVELMSGGGEAAEVIPYGLPVLVSSSCCVTGAKETAKGDLLAYIPKLATGAFGDGQQYTFGGSADMTSQDDIDGTQTLPNFVFGNAAARKACFVALPQMPEDVVMHLIGRVAVPTAPYVGGYDDPALANSKAGDVLEVRGGPFKGAYTIKSLVKTPFSLVVAEGDDISGALVFVEVEEDLGTVTAPYTERLLAEFKTGGGTPHADINVLLGDERDALNTFGFGYDNPTAEDITGIWAKQLVPYAYGDRGRGKIRLFFQDPLYLFMSAAYDTGVRFEDSSGLKFTIPVTQETQILPSRASTDPVDYPRHLTVDHGDKTILYLAVKDSDDDLSQKKSAWGLGLREGDIVEVHEERDIGLAVPDEHRHVLVTTVKGSNVLTLVTTTNQNWTLNGIYKDDVIVLSVGVPAPKVLRVTEAISATQVRVSEIQDTTRAELVTLGGHFGGSYDEANKAGLVDDEGGGVYKFRQIDNAAVFPATYDGKFLHLFDSVGGQAENGVYKITAVAGDNKKITIDDPADVFAGVGQAASWAVTDAKDGLLQIRVYSSAPTRRTITVIDDQDAEAYQLTLDSALPNMSIEPPHRFLRGGRVVAPKDMTDRENGLYYVDQEIVSLGVSDGYNIDGDEVLKLDPTTFEHEGYTVSVENEAYTFSVDEKPHIHLPSRLLPATLDDSPDNRVSVLGANVRVKYEHSALLVRVQALLDSLLDRVAVANGLARHMIPAYLYLEMRYSGGGSPTTLLPLLRAVIDSTRGDQRLELSDLEGELHKSGATFVDQAISMIAVMHGLDRKRIGVRTTNVFDGVVPAVLKGTARQVSYASGPNLDGDDKAFGERTNLSRA